MATFGGVSNSSISFSVTAERKYCTKFYCTTSGSLESITGLISADSGGSAAYSFGIYDDDGYGGAPDTLLGQTSTSSLAAGSSKGWRTLTFSSPPSVYSGHWYWLTLLTGTDGYLNLYYLPTGGTSGWSWDTWSSLESTFGSFGGTSSNSYRLYGTVSTTPANNAPNAPTLLLPVASATLNIGTIQQFSWTFSDPDSGDSQSAYNFKYRVNGTSTWTETGWTASAYGYHNVAASTFADATTYDWTVETKDALGEAGPAASSRTLTGASTSAPTITAPADGGTVNADSYTVIWSASTQEAYQVRTVKDDAGSPGTPDTGTVYEDTGTVVDSTTRSLAVAFDTSGRYEHVQVRVRINATDWTDWGSNYVDVDYTPPATPTIEITADSDAPAHIEIAPTQPSPTGGQPTVVGMDVYRSETNDAGAAVRIAEGVSPTATYSDYQVASDVDYWYFVRAIGDNTCTTDSALGT